MMIFIDDGKSIMGKTMELRHNSYFFNPCKHKINSVVRQITTLLKIFCMNLFILANINNIYSQRHLVVICTIFSSKMIGIFNVDEKLLSELFYLV